MMQDQAINVLTEFEIGGGNKPFVTTYEASVESMAHMAARRLSDFAPVNTPAGGGVVPSSLSMRAASLRTMTTTAATPITEYRA